jgi:hypothetical protein
VAEAAAAASLDGLRLDLGPLGSGSLGHMTFEGLDVSRPLSQILGGEKLAPTMLDGIKIGRIEYADMTVTPAGGTVIPIGTFSLAKLGFAQGVPVSAELAYGGLHLTSAQLHEPQAAAVFQMLGLDAATLSFGITYGYDPERKTLALHDVKLKVDELGMLEASVDAAGVEPNPQAPGTGQLTHALVRYTDASLADRMLRAQAAKAGGDPAAMRAQLVQAAQQQAAALGDSPALATAMRAVAAFLAEPRTLTIEMTPPQPVPLATLQQASSMPPPQLAALLGLTVTANQ